MTYRKREVTINEVICDHCGDFPLHSFTTIHPPKGKDLHACMSRDTKCLEKLKQRVKEEAA